MTAEKHQVSAIDYVATLKEAMALERRALRPGMSKATRDILSRCIADYNKMCGGNRRHRIDTATKNLVLNMLPGQPVRL